MAGILALGSLLSPPLADHLCLVSVGHVIGLCSGAFWGLAGCSNSARLGATLEKFSGVPRGSKALRKAFVRPVPPVWQGVIGRSQGEGG